MKEFLRKVDLFRDIADDDLDRVSRKLERHRFDPGVSIIVENQPASHCYMILSGTVRVTASLTDQQDCYAILGPGDHFGEVSLIDGQAASATVVAEQATEALSISRQDLLGLFESEPRLAAAILMSLLKAFCRRLRETDQSLSFTRLMMREGRN